MKNLFGMKFLFFTLAAVAAAGIFWSVFLKNKDADRATLTLHPADFLQQVSVSGKVVPAQSVDLAFSQTGRVGAVYAAVGDRVAAGAVLASIENADADADILQKSAARDAAAAKLQSLKNGTRPEQIEISQSAVAGAAAALTQTHQALADAMQNAYTQSDDAIRRRTDQFFSNPRSAQPKLNISVINSRLQSDIESQIIAMESLLASWKTALDAPIADSGAATLADTTERNLAAVRIFLDKTALAVNAAGASTNMSQTVIDGYRADITVARTNVNAAESSLTSALTAQKNAAAALTAAEKNLKLDTAGATAEDIAGAQAQVKSAEADLARGRADYQKTLVVAPFSGVITRMDAKVGASAASNGSAISLISADTFQIESFVPEINAPLVKIGNPADIVLDAYTGDAPFKAQVISMDPAETVRDGVSAYRIKLQFNQRDPRIKPGMSADIVITTEKKSHVIAVPQEIIITRNGEKFVSVKEKNATSERVVTVGSVSSMGTVEITSGLHDGDVIIINPAKK